MADKKRKPTKNIGLDQQKDPQKESAKGSLSGVFLDELKGTFTEFNKLSEEERWEKYWDKAYLEQFWDYFTQEHPNLLDKIDKKDLPVYIQSLENKWFTLENINKNAAKISNVCKDGDTEMHAIEKSLEQLQQVCETKSMGIPDGTFKKFADMAWFSHDKLVIDPDGAIKTIDDLLRLRDDFVKKEDIVIGEKVAKQIERVLSPDYSPTERMMVTVAITKIRKELKGKLKADFDKQFSLPIDIFTSYQDLLSFRDEWMQFLTDHSAEIDENLAKKLDRIIVTNGDIQKEILKSGRSFDTTKWFSEQEQYFRRIFNSLVTRQLFEEVEKTQKTIDHYVEAIGNTFKQFPPYVDQILTTYPFNANEISTVDTSFVADLDAIDHSIADLQDRYASATDDEKKTLREKIQQLKHQREERRWQAYILFLKTKNAALADIFAQLVASKFDFSVLGADQQQVILDVLVKDKLEDTIKNKVPELLSVSEEDITQFVHDLFDLKKMDITLPTRQWPVPLSFVKKEFLSSLRSQLPSINDLEDIGQLPLNFVTQLTPSNAAFFEESVIFDSIYTDFVARNGTFRLNDAYKVRIKKHGKIVEWYLSSYSPLQEYNDLSEVDGKEMYLYTEPVSSPNQERSLVTREGTSDGTPVMIKDQEQQECDVEILDKQIHLNGEAIWALLFGYVLGKESLNTKLSPQQEKKLAEKFGELATYKDQNTGEDEAVDPIVNSSETKVEASAKNPFLEERKKLKWYNFPEEKYKENGGFEKGTRLFLPFADSEVPPVENGKARLQMEIVGIDKNKWTFTVKMHGGELRLWKSEWATKEMPMTVESFESIRKAFGDKIYKLPPASWASFDQQMATLTASSLGDGFDKIFGSLKFDGGGLKYSLWDYIGKEVTHFGSYQPKAMDEKVDEESGRTILYKVKYNSNGTITVSGDSSDINYAKNFPARDMDYATFMLFIKEKKLQPKCKEQIASIHAKAKAEKEETPTTVRGYSINNVISFFKTAGNKITDGIKKYDEERAEDLTDLLTSQGDLWTNIGWFLSPFGRISSSFETMGMEYFLERDNRIWKKVEKRTKFYEDMDYTAVYFKHIKPMLDGKIKVVPHYKMAALLLVHLKKGKWPYAKDPKTTAQWSWIGNLLGKKHQARYLAIREKKIRDLEENAQTNGGPWADQVKNELVELEMRYIVHVMDGRHLGTGDDDKYYFQGKYSKKFCDNLEEAYTGFFKQDGVEEGFGKNKDANFEFARVEYFRQLADRPQQALPFLKVMATKATKPGEWEVFETAVLTGMLSGVFLNMTYASTQKYIQKICRTRGFIPWIFAKDVRQQHKLQRLLDLFSGGKFSKETKYNPSDYSFRENKWPGDFIKAFTDRTESGDNRHKLSKFLDTTGKNVDGNTLLDLYSDPKLQLSDKLLLGEYIDKTNEVNEELDPDVQKNTSSLTGSILTKSQSVVSQMITFDQTWFVGDGDTKNDKKKFCHEMQEIVPKGQTTPQQTKFFLGKFVNRFGERFPQNKKTELLKRLKWCNNPARSAQDVDDVLYYGIVGEIVQTLSRGAMPPDELADALWAWKNFFKNNMATILQSDVVSVFGPQAKSDVEKYTPKLEPWENAARLLDRDDKNIYMYSISRDPEKKAQATETQARMKSPNYLNNQLYLLADQLQKWCGIPNRFREAWALSIEAKKDSVQSIIKNTWAKIKNIDSLEKVKKIHEGKPLEEENPEDLLYQEADSYSDYWY